MSLIAYALLLTSTACGPVTDAAQVDPLLHAVGERVQAGRRPP